jgi:hypothetical protein
MPRTVCFTSFSLAYLARARVLAATVRKFHPDWEIWALVVDKPPPELDRAEAFAPFDQFCYAPSLGIPRFRAWMFKHDLVEGCTAVKGQMLLRLLQLGADRVVYLDPDIGLFDRLDLIEQRLDSASPDSASIVLTPHQTEANTSAAAIIDNEMTSLKYGIYNLGFLAVRNDANGRAFARWWAAMTYRSCYEAIEVGLFTDQKYCDLVPTLFDGVHIERDPGCNVASWNLSRRRLSFTAEGALLSNGVALKFYHFTKIGGVGDVMTDRYAGDNVEVHEVVNWYRRQLKANTIGAVANWPWHYGKFANGTPVPRAARLLFRGRPDLFDAFPDPLADDFHAWLAREMPAMLSPPGDAKH